MQVGGWRARHRAIFSHVCITHKLVGFEYRSKLVLRGNRGLERRNINATGLRYLRVVLSREGRKPRILMWPLSTIRPQSLRREIGSMTPRSKSILTAAFWFAVGFIVHGLLFYFHHHAR